MNVSCAPSLFNIYPEASIHGVIFDKVSLASASIVAEWKQRAIENIAERNIRPELLVENFAIKEWRDAYHRFGLKPSKYRSSIEQLYKRALKGDLIQTRNLLVNLYCYISIVNMVPMGGYDLGQVKGEIEIRYTKAGEIFQAIGEREPLQSPPNVVSYADDDGIICWAWNHRDSLRTALSEETQKAIFFADSATKSTHDMAKKAMKDLSESLLSAGCEKISEFKLDKSSNQTDMIFTSA